MSRIPLFCILYKFLFFLYITKWKKLRYIPIHVYWKHPIILWAAPSLNDNLTSNTRYILHTNALLLKWKWFAKEMVFKLAIIAPFLCVFSLFKFAMLCLCFALSRLTIALLLPRYYAFVALRHLCFVLRISFTLLRLYLTVLCLHFVSWRLDLWFALLRVEK